MDINAIILKMMELVKKYRYALLVLAVGIVLMVLPSRSRQEEPPVETTEVSNLCVDQTEALTQILTQIHGAGKVKLLLTMNSGEKILYQTDQDTTTGENTDSVRYETVIITDGDRAQQGLIQQTIAPEYRGAIVVCQGADDAAVRLAIVEAVSNATGLGTDRISVLKMK